MPDDPAQRLELHLAREFVRNYVQMALKRSRRAVVNPNAIFLAARFSGLKVSTQTLGKVLEEFQK